MNDTITCEWCAEEIPAGSPRCPKCQGSISAQGRRIQGTPLAAKATAPAQPVRTKPPAGWYDDPKMVNTRRYWDGAAWTEHRQEKVTQPPTAAPVAAQSGRDELAYVWVIALLPLTAIPIYIFQPDIADNAGFWISYWALTFFLAILDSRQLKQHGRKAPSPLGAMIIPGHLIERTRVVGSSVVIPIVWFAAAATAGATLAFAPAHYDFDHHMIEQDIASQYGDQLGHDIVVKCPEAKNVKAGDVIHCTATDSTGNDVLVRVEFNDQDGGSYIFHVE